MNSIWIILEAVYHCIFNVNGKKKKYGKHAAKKPLPKKEVW